MVNLQECTGDPAAITPPPAKESYLSFFLKCIKAKSKQAPESTNHTNPDTITSTSTSSDLGACPSYKDLLSTGKDCHGPRNRRNH